MKYKKGLIFVCLIICLFSIASVCASEVNETTLTSDDQSDDLIKIENQNEEISSANNAKINVANVNDLENNNANMSNFINDNGILVSSISQDEISLNNQYILSSSIYGDYPRSSSYHVYVKDTIINQNGGDIIMSISPANGYTYKYCYYLKVYDSNNNEKISKLYYSTSSASSKTCNIGSYQLSPGTYTIKIYNYGDAKMMTSAKLIVKSPTYPYYLDYSVSVSDISINYASNESIVMTISSKSTSTYYKYYYYLKVYDSNNNVKISKLYYSTSSDSSITCNIGSYQLGPGTYTIKIINYFDNNVMDTAKLTIIPSSTYPFYSDYSVSVSDVYVNYYSGLSESITMKISPSLGSSYKYSYYLKVYDSNNNEKISELYYSTSSASSKTYSISSYKFSPGTYTIKIINYKDNILMDTAKLIVKSKTYVGAENIKTTYGISKNLIVTLTDAKENLLIGKRVSVKLNGKTYSDKTNSRGQVSIKVPNNLVPKTYVASITFAGDDKYIASSGNVNVLVSKATPKITVKSITGNVGKKVRLTATVKDSVGNKLNKCTVTFKINGKVYNAKTNSKGIATLKVKIPKSKVVKVSSKIKNNIVTKSTIYKKIYTCKASVIEDNRYKSNSAKFKVISKNKKIQRYKIVKKETKTITVPYKQWGIRYKTVGHYKFVIVHEQREGNRISIAGGDKTLQKFIKFSSNAYYIFHGQKVYPWKWITSKKNDDIHQYFYDGNAKIYLIIKFNAYTYKKI